MIPTPIATTPLQDLPALPQSFFARPAEQVAPELICRLMTERKLSGESHWVLIVETKTYSQENLTCYGYDAGIKYLRRVWTTACWEISVKAGT